MVIGMRRTGGWFVTGLMAAACGTLFLPSMAEPASGGPCDYHPQELVLVEIVSAGDSGLLVELLEAPRHANSPGRGDRVDADPAEHRDIVVGDRFTMHLTVIRQGSCVPVYGWLEERVAPGAQP